MEEEADEMGGRPRRWGPSAAATALERKNSADVSNLGSSVALQHHTEEATPTHKQEGGDQVSTRLMKAEKSEPTTRAAKQVMLHPQDKAYK
jgi:hypothetical protein